MRLEDAPARVLEPLDSARAARRIVHVTHVTRGHEVVVAVTIHVEAKRNVVPALRIRHGDELRLAKGAVGRALHPYDLTHGLDQEARADDPVADLIPIH